MHKNETIENYLEAIYITSLKQAHVRAIDIVEYMNFSRPTVSVALKQLQNEGYLTIENNKIYLSEKGLNRAIKMYERHELIANLLIHLGVDPIVAYEDSCMIEHDISEESFEAIKNYYEKNMKS